MFDKPDRRKGLSLETEAVIEMIMNQRLERLVDCAWCGGDWCQAGDLLRQVRVMWRRGALNKNYPHTPPGRTWSTISSLNFSQFLTLEMEKEETGESSVENLQLKHKQNVPSLYEDQNVECYQPSTFYMISFPRPEVKDLTLTMYRERHLSPLWIVTSPPPPHPLPDGFPGLHVHLPDGSHGLVWW